MNNLFKGSVLFCVLLCFVSCAGPGGQEAFANGVQDAGFAGSGAILAGQVVDEDSENRGLWMAGGALAGYGISKMITNSRKKNAALDEREAYLRGVSDGAKRQFWAQKELRERQSQLEAGRGLQYLSLIHI